MKDNKENKFGAWLWWMDREDPRFGSTPLAKLGFLLAWTAGFLFLLLVAQLILYVLGHAGCAGGTAP